jgi:hypothetical protein
VVTIPSTNSDALCSHTKNNCLLMVLVTLVASIFESGDGV